MKTLLDRNNQEVFHLKSSERMRRVENMELKYNMAQLRNQLEEVKNTTDNKMQQMLRAVQIISSKSQAIKNEQPPNAARQSTSQLPPCHLIQPLNLTSQPARRQLNPTSSVSNMKRPRKSLTLSNQLKDQIRAALDSDNLAKKRKNEEPKCRYVTYIFSWRKKCSS